MTDHIGDANEMMRPVRLRLSRAKGFDLQAASMAANGLPAVNVARPSKWGNPHIWMEWRDSWPWPKEPYGPRPWQAETSRDKWCKEQAQDAFREDLSEMSVDELAAFSAGLRGKNLACWCRPGEPCHADVLLEIANK